MTINTGYTHDPDIYQRCRNLCSGIVEMVGKQQAGKIVGDLVATFDGEISPAFEWQLTGIYLGYLCAPKPIDPERDEAERAMRDEAAIDQWADARREYKFGKSL